MKFINRKYIFTTVLIMMIASLVAQEKNDLDISFLKDVYNTYNTANSYIMEVEVAMFDNEKTLAYPNQKNYTIKSNDNFFIETPELTTVQTANYQLLIDHISKEIRYISFNEEEQELFQTEQLKSSIPDFSLMQDVIESIRQNEGMTTVVFKENPQFKKTVYTFITSSKLLEQVDYYSEGSEYGQPAHIEIKYTTKNFNKEIDTNVFQLEGYVIETKDDLKLSDSYKTYSLINKNSSQ